MHQLSAYRCRDGNYLIARPGTGLGESERDGLVCYIGSVSPEQFGPELGTWISQAIGEQDFAWIPSAQFYSSDRVSRTVAVEESGQCADEAEFAHRVAADPA